MSTVKVVILNWNGAAVLPRFLPSVIHNTPPGVEIIVADNGSTDNSRELLSRDFPEITQLNLDKNYGFAQGYNLALAQLDSQNTDFFVLLNSDVETPEGWLSPLVSILESHPNIAAVAPKILSVNDPASFEYAGASGGFLDSLGYPFCRGRILDTVEKDAGQYDDTRQVMWATGACFVVRASVFRKLGGFDGDFFAHQEEIDLCWRIQLAGLKVMIEPQSVVYHLGAGTLPPSPQKLYLNYRNNLAMLYKNLPVSRLWWIICLRIVMNFGSSLIYLLRGQLRNFAAVWRAHRDFRKMRISLRKKRYAVQSLRLATQTAGQPAPETTQTAQSGHQTPRLTGIYRGSILLAYLFGCKRFSDIPARRIS